MEVQRKVLIAVLNWGLGHAARCIPIITELEAMGHRPVLASDGASMYLLRAEFPHLTVEELPSYRIRYNSANMIFNIAKQLPRILWAIRSERKAMGRLVKQYGITHIISDNRYGCYHGNTRNTLLTHQLHLQASHPTVRWLANALLQKAFARFEEIWVPDMAENNGLAGMLAHPPLDSPPVHYIGLLSRMRISKSYESQYDVAIVLSGPEPQRTILEQRLTEQAIALPYKFIIVQGRPKHKYHHFITENVEIVSYLTSVELNEVMQCSDMIVCRAGYSSIMDLAVMGKKAFLIPTPGQTEQEYLAADLLGKGIFFSQTQEQINLEYALKHLRTTTGLNPLQYRNDLFASFLK